MLALGVRARPGDGGPRGRRGAIILVPSLALLFTLLLRGRLDTPESHAPGEAEAALGPPRRGLAPGEAAVSGATAPSARRMRAWGAAAAAGLVAGSGLLVFADAAWALLPGVACFVLCGVAAFTLTATAPDR